MAGGLGTRMQSATPEAPAPAARAAHGRLGDRRRARRPAPTASSSSPRRRRATPSTGVEIAVQEQPRGTGDAVRVARARALEGFAGDVLVLNGDVPAADRRPARRARRDASPRRTPPATVLSFEPRRRRSPTAASSATPTGRLARIVEARDASAGGARARRGQLRHLRLPRRRALAGARAARAAQRAGRALPHRHARPPRRGRRAPSRCTSRPTRARSRAINTRVELAAAAARTCATGSTSAHMLAGVTIVDPADDLDRADASSSSPTPSSTRSPSCAARRASRRAPSSARTSVAIDADDRCRMRPSDRSVTFAPEPSSGSGAKAGTFVEIKNSQHRRAHEGAPPLVHRRRGDRRGHERRRRRDHRQLPAPARARRRARTTIGSNVRTGVHNAFVAPVTVGDDAWIAAGSVITEDVPAGRARARARTAGQQGGVCRSSTRRRLSSSACRAWTRSTGDAQPQGGHFIERRPAEAADGLRRPLAPGARRAHRRAHRHRARRDRARDLRERRDVRAATTSRSAAPTSSSSRPAARRSTGTSWSSPS